MPPMAFCDWLQGFFDAIDGGANELLSAKRVNQIKQRLASVEIDVAATVGKTLDRPGGDEPFVEADGSWEKRWGDLFRFIENCAQMKRAPTLGEVERQWRKIVQEKA